MNILTKNKTPGNVLNSYWAAFRWLFVIQFMYQFIYQVNLSEISLFQLQTMVSDFWSLTVQCAKQKIHWKFDEINTYFTHNSAADAYDRKDRHHDKRQLPSKDESR